MKRSDILLMTALFWGLSAGLAAQPYPVKPVTIIVPYAPGGITDVTGRQMAAAMGERWGQSVIVENRPGGGTIIGTTAAAKAQPDGYALLLTSFGYTTNQILVSDLPYDPAALSAVILVGTAPNVLYVHPRLPVHTAQDIIEYAKSHPKEMTFASSGNASSPHIAAELFASVAGIEMTHVPYKGTGPAMLDLLGGRVQGIFDTMQSMAYAKAGKLRAIAVANSRRLSQAPELQTFAEQGMPSIVSASWFGFFTQRKVPSAIQTKLYEDMRKILESPGMRARVVQAGLEPSLLTREEFATFLDAELKKWGHIIRTRNIRLEP